MKTEYQISRELEEMRAELSEVMLMSEEQACYIHNVDSKQEIIDILNEEIAALESELEEASLPTSYELEAAGERYGYDYY